LDLLEQNISFFLSPVKGGKEEGKKVNHKRSKMEENKSQIQDLYTKERVLRHKSGQTIKKGEMDQKVRAVLCSNQPPRKEISEGTGMDDNFEEAPVAAMRDKSAFCSPPPAGLAEKGMGWASFEALIGNLMRGDVMV